MGIKRLRWTEETIENELRNYRANKCYAEEWRLDLEALRENLTLQRDACIEGAVLHGAGEQGMPGSGSPSDGTGRLALRLPDEMEEISAAVQLSGLRRRIQRVDAWLNALTNRERIIIKMLYIDGMVWGEVVHAYNQHPSDGFCRDERTLKRWRNEAIQRIKVVANV